MKISATSGSEEPTNSSSAATLQPPTKAETTSKAPADAEGPGPESAATEPKETQQNGDLENAKPQTADSQQE